MKSAIEVCTIDHMSPRLLEASDLIRNIEKDWRERVVKNNLDLIILRLLRQKPQWGYEVNISIRDRFRVYLSAGTLYPLLHSLEEEGYIQGEWESEGTRKTNLQDHRKRNGFLGSRRTCNTRIVTDDAKPSPRTPTPIRRVLTLHKYESNMNNE